MDALDAKSRDEFVRNKVGTPEVAQPHSPDDGTFTRWGWISRSAMSSPRGAGIVDERSRVEMTV